MFQDITTAQQQLQVAEKQLEEMKRPVKSGFWAGLGAFIVGCVVSVVTFNPIGAIAGLTVARKIWSNDD